MHRIKPRCSDQWAEATPSMRHDIVFDQYGSCWRWAVGILWSTDLREGDIATRGYGVST